MDLTGLDKHPVKLELLPHLVDRIAREQPQKTWLVCPRVSSDPSQGFDDICYAAAANAINHTAWFFEQALGKPQPGKFPVVSYTGTADLRYCLLPIALVKCGYQILLLSDLSSADMREHLLKAADCRLFACAVSSSNDPVLARLGLKPIIVPELKDLLVTDLIEPYPYSKTTEQGLNDPLMKLHTSGTSSLTGRPKIVTYTMGTACASQLQRLVPSLNGHENSFVKDAELTRIYTAFRISHAGGVWISFRFMYQGVAIVHGGDDPLSLNTFQHVLDSTGIDGALLPPILLEAIAIRPDLVCQLSKLKQVLYAGGPLSATAGNEIARHALLYTRYGSTENAAPVTTHVTDPEDWQYCHFNPKYSGFSWRRYPPHDPTSKLSEAVVIRHPDPLVRHEQPVFWNFPDTTEWPMEDLFEPHPTKADHWKYAGRRDDMIIVGNGTNIMPTFFEQEMLQQDPRVKKAVMYGDGEAHLAVLIELANSVEEGLEMEHAKVDIWPLVDCCNQLISRGTQLPRHAIVIAKKDKPLPRGGKGDVQRKLAKAMYETELAEVFKGSEMNVR
ncbi:hypothetical protein LTR70_009372 [Exophiala xenobiotica]|uniref:AMP-dependent synthetase/ligase domain-containing protein n=1 Tax=Lithohypha guttulata TaxID=1690604 RepID=A0ABR0JXY5_9EURO|nr:hypothetical protein LTR24_009189 [Lithohypha guttulata]KAK5310579.1 hypothetical protein LTR70_009372 [Exophiala xenobiotica]